MARIWMSGLEAGHIDVFAIQNGGAISAAQARTGSYSWYCGSILPWVGSPFAANETEIYGRIAIRPAFASYDSRGNEILVLLDDVGDAQITIQLQQNVCLVQVRRGSYTGTIIGRGGELHQNRWHCIEFRLVVDNAVGVFQLKIDGTQVINFSGDTQATANAHVRTFRLGRHTGSGHSCPGYYDDIAFNDVAGGVNDSWIGRGGIPAIFPTGAGASTDLDLVPDTGEANWEDVDEVPPDDDASYVFDAVVDEHDSYAASNLAAAGTISAVQWLARARSDLAGDPKIARILRIGGVDHQGDDIGIGVSYDCYTDILDEDPEAAGAWLVAAVNGMEIGVKVR